jgi:hypothetical protein
MLDAGYLIRDTVKNRFSLAFNEAPRSKSPTRQSRYGDGALRGILAKANKIGRFTCLIPYPGTCIQDLFINGTTMF